MAGPVPTYLTTQLATQTAFTVPFGLLSLVNSKIATAVAAGEFNTTVDCSLFVTEDVSNLRIYLDSLGYTVEFAKNTNDKSLLIDWGKFLDIPGTEVIVDQGTSPWIIAGTVTADSPSLALRADYDGNSFLIYYGTAIAGSLTSAAVWSIRKLAYDGNGNFESMTWPSGSTASTFVWDDRVSYSYS